jgi:hypothetical protein
MPHSKNIYNRLQQKGYTKRQIHAALHKYMLLQIKQEQATGCKLHKQPSMFSKESHFLKNLISAVVSFIKTQFAKKPKNPV